MDWLQIFTEVLVLIVQLMVSYYVVIVIFTIATDKNIMYCRNYYTKYFEDLNYTTN